MIGQSPKKKTRRGCPAAIAIGLIIVILSIIAPSPRFTSSSAADLPVIRQEEKVCSPKPIIMPVLPKVVPGYAGLDRETGLHITGKAPGIDFLKYRLAVSGKVDRPHELTYDELRCMPKVTARPELVCPGFFVDVATWSGVPLKHILEKAGVRPGAREVRLTAADKYMVVLSMRQAMAPGAFIAYEWEGKPLPILHGFPVRAVLPGLEGNQWVKWLIRIDVN